MASSGMPSSSSSLGRKRVLILSASAGTGHVRAGDALAKSFAADPRTQAVKHIDALDFTNKLFHNFYSKFYLFCHMYGV